MKLLGCVALSLLLWLPISLRLAAGWSPPPGVALGLYLLKLVIWVVPLAVALRPRWDELRLGPPVRLDPWAIAAGIGFLAAVTGLQAALSGQAPRLGPVGVRPVNDVVEEIVFRGLLLAALERRLGARWGNALCAALFVSVHLPGWWAAGMRVEILIAGP